MQLELVGVPYTSMAEPGGIARAIAVLRSEGLAERLAGAGAHDTGDLHLLAGDGRRGPSGLLSEAALGRLVVATREAVAAGRTRSRVPLLVGGDCPVILGALAAVRDHHGACGLLHVDGHEDAWPPAASPTGEASDSEVAIALGRVVGPLPAPLDELCPLLGPRAMAMLGPRDRAEIEEGSVASLGAEVALFRDDVALRDHGPAACAAEAVAALAREAPAFWLHLDLDVLSTAALAAVDYPQPGGLTWEELSELALAALAAPGCTGASVAIYNPDRDEGGAGARRIVDFAERLATAVQ